MDITFIDQLSNNGDGHLHRASVISKILLTGCIITAVIISDSFWQSAFIFAALMLIAYFNRIPVLKILNFVMYPVFFSIMFALIRFSYSFEAGFIIIFKAVNAALGMLLLITTTPYIKVFSFFRLFLPGILVDGMFFTYRMFFILIEKLNNSLTVIKLRGGLKPANLIFNLKNLAGVIGILFINAFGMSERLYNIYALRGYEGRLYPAGDCCRFKRSDYLPVSLGLVILIVVVVL